MLEEVLLVIFPGVKKTKNKQIIVIQGKLITGYETTLTGTASPTCNSCQVIALPGFITLATPFQTQIVNTCRQI